MRAYIYASRGKRVKGSSILCKYMSWMLYQDLRGYRKHCIPVCIDVCCMNRLEAVYLFTGKGTVKTYGSCDKC